MTLENVCVLKFNTPNKNNRVYSPDCFNLEDSIVEQKLKTGTFFGEFGMPQERTEIDMTKISHVVTNLYKREDGLYADIELLETPFGSVLQDLIDKGRDITSNFRTRGTGRLVKTEGSDTYNVEDFVLYGIDYTDYPS